MATESFASTKESNKLIIMNAKQIEIFLSFIFLWNLLIIIEGVVFEYLLG